MRCFNTSILISIRSMSFLMTSMSAVFSSILCPHSSGVISNLILDVYRGCFEKIFIWSPTIFLDDNWNAAKNYI